MCKGFFSFLILCFFPSSRPPVTLFVKRTEIFCDVWFHYETINYVFITKHYLRGFFPTSFPLHHHPPFVDCCASCHSIDEDNVSYLFYTLKRSKKPTFPLQLFRVYTAVCRVILFFFSNLFIRSGLTLNSSPCNLYYKFHFGAVLTRMKKFVLRIGAGTYGDINLIVYALWLIVGKLLGKYEPMYMYVQIYNENTKVLNFSSGLTSWRAILADCRSGEAKNRI